MKTHEWFPTLFKIDSKDVVREWDIEAVDDVFIVKYGVQGGKKISKITKCKSKNVGRANETSPKQQAKAEAKARWVKQKERECYVEDLNDPAPYLQPMLARDAMKVPKQVKWQEKQFGQVKLDGVRALHVPSKENVLQSRKGTFFPLPFLYRQLSFLKERCTFLPRGFEFDGETYLHGVPLNEINSASKKYDENLTLQLQFHIFDLHTKGKMPYELRRALLQKVQGVIDEQGIDNVVTVPSFEIRKETLEEEYEIAVSRGYEGIMLRKADGVYGVGERPDVLFKYKGVFMDEEFDIVDVLPDKQGGARVVFRSPKGADPSKPTFIARPKGTDAYRRKLLEDKELIIGKRGTVKFFAYTSYGIPQFPVCIDIDPVK